jgi:hypothetical protein
VGFFRYSVALGTSYLSAIPAGRSGLSDRPSRAAALNLVAVAPFVRRQGHRSRSNLPSFLIVPGTVEM